jgi:hypothetical protein
MTETKKQRKAAPLPGTVAPLPAPLAPPAAPPAARQASYRERERERHNRNAQIANAAMGIVFRVRTLWDMDIDLRGVTRDADEVQTLTELSKFVTWLADPFTDSPAVVHKSRVTVAPTKGRALSRRQRERVGK